MSSRSAQAGYTVIELLSTIAIIGVLSALVIANTRVGGARQQLRDSASLYVVAAKKAESSATASTPINGISRKAYGICITSSDIIRVHPSDAPCQVPAAGQKVDMFEVYARQTTDTSYTQLPTKASPDNPDIIETRTFPKGIEFTSAQYWIDYFPPLPTIAVNGDSTIAQAEIDLQVTGDPSYVKKIFIRPGAGAVYVQ